MASRAGAIPEVTGPSGEAATLVEPGDVNKLVAAIADLLDHPAKRTAYGLAGRARVERLFSWRAVAQNMVVAYEDAIAAYRKEHDADRRL